MKRKKTLVIVCIAVILAVVLVFQLLPKAPAQRRLRLYAGAGLRPAVEKLIAAFKKKSGIEIEADYGGSGLVLSRAREDKDADLFLPGDAWYVKRLQELAGRVDEQATVAFFVPTIIVAKGNPKKIKGLSDLARADVHVGLGDPKACQIGRVSKSILAKAGVQPVPANVRYSLTVNELGVWVKLRNVDAAIVWDAIAKTIIADVEMISIPPSEREVSEVVLARLSGSKMPDAARRFLAFAKSDEGQTILTESGYRVTSP